MSSRRGADNSPEINLDGVRQTTTLIAPVSPNPDFNDKSYYSHLDEPPSPNGPEKNVVAATVVVAAVGAHGGVGDFAAGGGGARAPSSSSVGTDAPSSSSPERTAATAAAVFVRVGREGGRYSKHSVNDRPANHKRGGAGGGGGGGPSSAASNPPGSSSASAEARPKGILRNSSRAIPILQFGKPVSSSSGSLLSPSSSIVEDSNLNVSERKVQTTLALVPASAAAAFPSVPPSVDRGGSIHGSASVCYKNRVLWYLHTVFTYQSHVTTL